MASFDLVVAGAGIVGLAHALAAARRKLRVAVVECDAKASGASVRNFGFVTVTGQAGGATRERALRSREVWEEVAEAAGIPILQRGAVIVARREEAHAVLREFAASPGGEGCRLWDAARASTELPMLAPGTQGALWSPHEIRIEARDAIARVAAWLESRGVAFQRGTAFDFDGKRLRHSGGTIDAGAAVFAPGNAAASMFPAIGLRERVRSCKLQMMRLASPGWRLPGVAMGDLSLVRYEGFASQPSARALRMRLGLEAPEWLARGIHVIAAQSADGSLVVGDSHAYGESPDAFADAATDALILGELKALFRLEGEEVLERWNGYYPVADTKPLLREALGERARLVVVTSGTGMSTAFAIGEETVAELFG
jgi:FAD dependent oxidoreductase TIGR03364